MSELAPITTVAGCSRDRTPGTWGLKYHEETLWKRRAVCQECWAVYNEYLMVGRGDPCPLCGSLDLKYEICRYQQATYRDVETKSGIFRTKKTESVLAQAAHWQIRRDHERKLK